MLRALIAALVAGLLIGGGLLVFGNRRALPPPGTAELGLSALEAAHRLKAQGLPIGTIQTHPSPRYHSDVTFTDLRLHRNRTSRGIAISDGGAVEVLADTIEATDRIYELHSGRGLRGEYDYVFGAIVLRLSPQLTRGQATAYQTDLYRIAEVRGG